MRYTSLLLIALVWFACKNNSPATTKTDVKKTEAETTAQTDTNVYRLVILFYSIGEGTEAKFMKALNDSVQSYSVQKNKVIDFKKYSWGREGETDFTFRLNELSPAEQKEFVAFTKATLKDAKWVNIYENYLYHHRGK